MSASDFEDDFSGNIIRPFQLETSSLRGRIVRFNSVLNEILEPHNYPHIVSQLLAETITLCALLSSMLKYDGIFTLQTQGNGPISMLVADVTSDGKIRGCASFDKKRLDIVEKQLAAFSDQIGELSLTIGSRSQTRPITDALAGVDTWWNVGAVSIHVVGAAAGIILLTFGEDGTGPATGAHLTPEQRDRILIGLNQYPNLSEKYVSVSPFGDLVSEKKTTSWREL